MPFIIVSVLVNGTLIPLDHCYGDSSHSKGFSGEYYIHFSLALHRFYSEYHGTLFVFQVHQLWQL